MPPEQSRQHGDGGDSQAGVTGAACVSSQPHQVLSEDPPGLTGPPSPPPSTPAPASGCAPHAPSSNPRGPVLSSDTTLPCPFPTASSLCLLCCRLPCSPGPFLTGGTPYELCDLQARDLNFLSPSVLIRGMDIIVPTPRGGHHQGSPPVSTQQMSPFLSPLSPCSPRSLAPRVLGSM